MALPVNVSGLRRNIKNIAHNYTDAQVKVREATSNDPWGPSSTIMSEIADLTYNVVAFSEIMQMVWKRLNDHGKNWRHVYKALVLLEYLIKTGSEKVAEQSRENIHSISTLKDFQYIEEGKDQGINVREKAKAMVALLKDDERLRNERVRALKAKERFAQSVSGIAGDPDINSPTSPTYPGTFVTSASRAERDAYGIRERAPDYGELESARPHTLGEEELQLQLALAMSKEEADHEEARRRSDDVRLQMALNESKDEKSDNGTVMERERSRETQDKSGISDLLDINFNPPHSSPPTPLGAMGGLGLGSPLSPPSAARDPWGLSPPAADTQPVDPWGVPAPKLQTVSPPPLSPPKADPWSAGTPHMTSPPPAAATLNNDPWAPAPPAAIPSVTAAGASDPWGPVIPPVDPWGVVRSPTPPPDPFAPLPPQPPHADDFSLLTNRDKPATGTTPAGTSPPTRRSPAGFLGENSGLVNLDNLVASKPVNPIGANPFSGSVMGGGAVGVVPNPFQAAQSPKPSINELRASAVGGFNDPWGAPPHNNGFAALSTKGNDPF